MLAMRPSSAAVTYSAVKDQLVSLSLEIEVRTRLCLRRIGLAEDRPRLTKNEGAHVRVSSRLTMASVTACIQPYQACCAYDAPS